MRPWLGLVWCVFAVAVMGVQASAQQGGGGGLSDAQTNRVVASIEAVLKECRVVPAAYQPDCLSRALQAGARHISNNPGYWEAHVALTRAVRSLSGLVRERADPDAARLRAAGYRLRAVRAGDGFALRAAGAQILDRVRQDLESLAPFEARNFAPIVRLLRDVPTWP